jgi:hypothetical protein
VATTVEPVTPAPPRVEAPAPATGLSATDAAAGRFWVTVGALWLALCVWAWGGWIISGDFAANKLDAGAAPGWYKVMVHGTEVFAVVVTGWILWRFVIRDKRRTGSLSFDGLFFLACWMLLIQEPWINWVSDQFMYSTVAINFGSWTSHIPLWSSPNSQLVPLPIVWVGTAYLWLVAIPAYAGSRFMTYQRRRNPGIGFFRLLGTTFLAFVVFDLILEAVIVRTQLFSYASTVPSLTLFAGSKYQFPLYETVSWCSTYLGLACIHHFRDDKGRTLVERGVDRLRVAGRLKTFCRFLAIMGACQLVMLVTYNIPYMYWGLHAGPTPRSLAIEGWRNGGVCGTQSPFACPNPRDPIAKRGSPTNRIP